MSDVATDMARRPQAQQPTMNAPTIVNTGPQQGDGNMGLKGLVALVSNTTAMALIAVVMLYAVLWQLPAMHREATEAMKQSMADERAFYREDRAAMLRVIDRNTTAVVELTNEVRTARQMRGKE